MTAIGEKGLAGYSALIELSIPASVTSIGAFAFQGSPLQTVRVSSSTPCTIGELGTFDAANCDLYVPVGSYPDYLDADNWKEFNFVGLHQLTIGNLNYATLYLDYNVSIPEGLSAYSIHSVGEGKALLTEITDVIPANTGVVLNATPGVYNLFYTDVPTTTIQNNMLDGVTVETELNEAGFHFYKLSDGDSGLGFYLANTEGTLTCKANKAYLKLSATAASPLRSFNLAFGGATDIDVVETEDGVVDVYSIHGMRLRTKVARGEALNSLPAGIYIVEGKKRIKQ